MDIFTPEKRSDVMSRIRSSDTKPEVRLRKALFALGYRYRKNVRELPGTPDIVLPKHRYAIQVRGCFWHRHQNCSRAHEPSTNTNYWLPKLERTVTRDKKNDRALRALGWRLRVIWECDISKPKQVERVAARICADLRKK